MESDAAAGRYGLQQVGKANGKPGDIITFQFDADANADHIGLVEKNLGAGAYQCIEGNTSTSSDSNGGRGDAPHARQLGRSPV